MRELPGGASASASAVVRDALRHMEERDARLAVQRAHLAEGEKQASRGEFVEDYSLQSLLAEMDHEG